MESTKLGTEWFVEQLRNGKELNDDLINQAKEIELSNFVKPKEVLIEDYEQNVAMFKLILNGVGIVTDYVTTDLVYECTKLLKSKGGRANVEDMCRLKAEHLKKWNDYFEKKSENEKVVE